MSSKCQSEKLIKNELEAALSNIISASELHIVECRRKIEVYEDEIQREKFREHDLLDTLKDAKDKLFKIKYDVPSETVRESYINRLKMLCKPCWDKAHYVKYKSIQPSKNKSANYNVINPDASHIYLPSENIDEASLSEKETDAFAVLGLMVWIDPNPHTESWGN